MCIGSAAGAQATAGGSRGCHVGSDLECMMVYASAGDGSEHQQQQWIRAVVLSRPSRAFGHPGDTATARAADARYKQRSRAAGDSGRAIISSAAFNGTVSMTWGGRSRTRDTLFALEHAFELQRATRRLWC